MELSPIKLCVEVMTLVCKSYCRIFWCMYLQCISQVVAICLSLNNVRITADKNNGQQ